MKPWIIGAAGALALAATPVYALDVSKSQQTDAAPGAVWSAVGDFCGIADWHPAVAKCEASEEGGKTRRTLTLAGGGGTLVEELVSRDDDKMQYTYRIVDGPLPVQNYESTISVAPSGDGSTISWTGHFDAKGASDDKAEEVIGGIYDAGLKGIADKTTQ